MELSFSQNVDLPEEGQWQIVQSLFTINDVEFDISGTDTIELSIKIHTRLRVARYDEITCTEALTAVKEESRKKPDSSLLYASGDTMWSIAKRYRIPLSRLALDNGLDASENPPVGKKLFIM